MKYISIVLWVCFLFIYENKVNNSMLIAKDMKKIVINKQTKIVIYYVDLNALFYAPVTKEYILGDGYNLKIIVKHPISKQKTKIINKIKKLNLKKVKVSNIDYRIFCIIYNNTEQVYSVGLGYGDAMLINNQFYKKNMLFYKLIKGYLPSCENSKMIDFKKDFKN